MGTEGYPHTRWATLVFLRNWALPGVVLGWVAESVSLSGDHWSYHTAPRCPMWLISPHVGASRVDSWGCSLASETQCLGQTLYHVARSAGLMGG